MDNEIKYIPVQAQYDILASPGFVLTHWEQDLITSDALAVYLILSRWTSKVTKYSLNAQRISDECPLSKRSVQNAIKCLKHTKLLKVKKLQSGYLVYSLSNISQNADSALCSRSQSAKSAFSSCTRVLTSTLDTSRISSGIKKEKKLDKKNKKVISSSKQPELSKSFIQWWKSYNKKINKQNCIQLWKKLTPIEIEMVRKHTSWYVKKNWCKKEGSQYLKNPDRYLKEQVWRDIIPDKKKFIPIKDRVQDPRALDEIKARKKEQEARRKKRRKKDRG